MIPRHSLQFGVGKILSILISPTPTTDPSDIEKAYADTLGIPSVILLPSVRAGIHMAIQATGGPGMVVVGPAYTCETVHGALALSKARVRLIDSAPDAFLMSPGDIVAATEPGCALLLSEVYGIPYDPEIFQKVRGKALRVRIRDMAMSIPTAEKMRKLEAADVALFSFGWGKPMYAGWGGVACFQDLELAGRVREIRDRWSAPETFGLRFRHGGSILFRVWINQRLPYGLSHERHLYRFYRSLTRSAALSPTFEGGDGKRRSGSTLSLRPELRPRGKPRHLWWGVEGLTFLRSRQGHASTTRGSGAPFGPDRASHALGLEWTCPMTALNRKLALHNLRRSLESADLRRHQAEVYSKELVEPGILRGPGNKALPESHFPVRVPSAVRDTLCDDLRGRGIDTSVLFPFPVHLSRDGYPHAAEAADEVVALPLGPSLTPEEVRRISRCLKEGLRASGC
jgi:dTDP-4-amino-4,6-dideoxygalactose transaminase